MTDQTVWDYLVAFVTIAALAIGLISMAVGQLARWRDRYVARPSQRRRYRIMSRPRMVRRAVAAVNPNIGVRAEIPLLNGAEPYAEPFVNQVELHLNADELAAVGRMIGHNRTATKPSKSSTIAAGFGVSRGGSESYKRASVIYDALFGPPAPAVQYRELTPEQEAMRRSLQMKQKGALH